jgi:hypothetical protein
LERVAVVLLGMLGGSAVGLVTGGMGLLIQHPENRWTTGRGDNSNAVVLVCAGFTLLTLAAGALAGGAIGYSASTALSE